MNGALKKVDEFVKNVLPYPSFMYFDSRGNIKISPSKLLDYCGMEGFMLYEERVIYMQDKIAEIVDGSNIYQYCLKYVKSFDQSNFESVFITRGESLLIKNKGILLGLPICKEKLFKDSINKGFFYYSNGIVKVEKDNDVQLLPYGSVDGFIWKQNIKNREFTPLPDIEIEKGIFNQFVINTSNNERHLKSNLTGFGYAIHGYKDPSNPKAIIINDENLADNGKPEGGTGKGLYVKAIKNIISVASYNGKNSDFGNNRFAYQNVTQATRAIFIDDVDRNFPLETLFSVITDDLIIERKHKDIETIKYKSSPKFIITTNYTIRGNSSSYARRRFDVFLNDYYGELRKPIDDFKCEFFHGWDSKEWNRFDNFMMACLLQFLLLGLIEYRSEELEIKMLKHETSHEFIEVMEDEDGFGTLGIRHHQSKIKQAVVDKNPSRFMKTMSNRRLNSWIKAYAKHKGYKITHGRDHSTYYEFSKE